MRCLRRHTGGCLRRMFVGGTEMDDLGVVGMLGLENFEQQTESCKVEFVKELDFYE